jgi:hypothetical protein
LKQEQAPPTALAPSTSDSPKGPLTDAPPEAFAERLFLRGLRGATLERFALRALLQAQHLLGLALGQILARMRASQALRNRR